MSDLFTSFGIALICVSAIAFLFLPKMIYNTIKMAIYRRNAKQLPITKRLTLDNKYTNLMKSNKG